MKKGLLFLFVFALCSGLAGAAGVAHADDNKPVVVASTTQIADFARHVVGDSCVVRSILAPGADPHTYSPTPDDIRIVLGADLTLENGLHLEGKNWMATLAKDAGKPIVTCTEGIRPLEIPAEGQSVHDPHAWFSPANAAVYVNNITRAVGNLLPDHKAAFQARAKLYLQQLRVLDAWIREQVATIPPHRRILVTTHDAFNYFCREFRFNEGNGYLSIAPVGWSTGSEVGAGMTPERRKQVIESIKGSGAPAIFVETTISPKLIREIARDTGVAVGGELYSDSMGEAGTAGETYIGMMRENVLLIVAALGGK
ncbi:MAG: metal ABC transporter solute-binding protein, Zn/Mn family [Desulfovibrionaceae bacterium]